MKPFLLIAAGLLATPAAAEQIETDRALLGALDKVTARVSELEAPVGQTARFGTLEIIVRTCLTRPPEDPPEDAAFLDIWESQPGEPPEEVFRGWMFSSSPAVSAMEHPVYDVWVLDCPTSDAGASDPNTSSTGAGSSTGN